MKRETNFSLENSMEKLVPAMRVCRLILKLTSDKSIWLMNGNTLDNKSLHVAFVVIIITMIMKFTRLLSPLSNFPLAEKSHAKSKLKNNSRHFIDAINLKAMKVINFETRPLLHRVGGWFNDNFIALCSPIAHGFICWIYEYHGRHVGFSNLNHALAPIEIISFDSPSYSL